MIITKLSSINEFLFEKPRYSILFAGAGLALIGHSCYSIHATPSERLARFYALSDSIRNYSVEQVIRDPNAFKQVENFMNESDSLKLSGIESDMGQYKKESKKAANKFLLEYGTGAVLLSLGLTGLVYIPARRKRQIEAPHTST